MFNTRLLSLLLISLFLLACKKDQKSPLVETNGGYNLSYQGFPKPFIAEDNPLTLEGVELGRRLFYEKKLSKDNTMSCASCHAQKNAFADTNRFSVGVAGKAGKRQAMAIFNMAWNRNEFFWDGRAHLLRDQALLPIQDPLEMNETLENVIQKLSTENDYSIRFKKAFGSPEITSLNISKALEQFMNSIVSNNSKYDRFLVGKASLTPSEERGRKLFFQPVNRMNALKSGANCVDCHNGPNFENNGYMNNGLDTENEMKDIGREKVTKSVLNKGMFKVPSLRNVSLTPPYMHDGRFQTLEEVVDHYDNNVKLSPTLNPTMRSVQTSGGLKLTAQQKKDLVAFMKTLIDEQLINEPKFSDPFK